ncbi:MULTISPECIES: hypothetical protein [Rhizobium]|uniref:Uncharacterized protein n=1 Tax=Rhizobium phaseoli TaxID=396 RepID=A0A7X6F9D0_9HYPH|nr:MULTISPECIES: hypothetical protein [Rhizobium]MDE8763077.1 hypothetical protein [Rhizobium sp. CBK13]NKF13371.1 hypothetical protein [Rhizobium phaseoli]QPK12566.1 hypothetical protein HER27_031745 [Rhizobium phaseoli]
MPLPNSFTRAFSGNAKHRSTTGRRLANLGRIAGHFFPKGKLGLKTAVKVPFFVDIEITFETDWNRRR